MIFFFPLLLCHVLAKQCSMWFSPTWSTSEWKWRSPVASNTSELALISCPKLRFDHCKHTFPNIWSIVLTVLSGCLLSCLHRIQLFPCSLSLLVITILLFLNFTCTEEHQTWKRRWREGEKASISQHPEPTAPSQQSGLHIRSGLCKGHPLLLKTCRVAGAAALIHAL